MEGWLRTTGLTTFPPYADVVMGRPGQRVARRKHCTSRVGFSHRVKREETMVRLPSLFPFCLSVDAELTVVCLRRPGSSSASTVSSSAARTKHFRPQHWNDCCVSNASGLLRAWGRERGEEEAREAGESWGGGGKGVERERRKEGLVFFASFSAFGRFDGTKVSVLPLHASATLVLLLLSRLPQLH
jgi:hypothetical protein